MRHKTTQTVFEYFNRVRNGEPAPLRADINPVELKSALPDIFMLEMARNGAIHFRLAGTRVCTILGRELRGEDFNLLWCKTDRHKMKLATEAMLANQAPLVVRLRSIAEDEADGSLEMLLLPLNSRPGKCDRVFGSLADISPPAFRREQLRLLRADGLSFPQSPRIVGDWSDADSEAPLTVATAQVSALRTKIMQLKVFEGGRRD